VDLIHGGSGQADGGLVVIEDAGRRMVGVGYSDGALVKLAAVAAAAGP